MSWNAHTDHIFSQVPGQVSYILLTGPDGSKWGESGTAPMSIAASDVADVRSKPTQGLKLGGTKYMFLRELDPFYIYNLSGKGAAFLKAGQYSAIAFAGEGYKAEQAVTALEKLKTYLATLGYN